MCREKIKIVLVEDDPDDVLLLTKLLEAAPGRAFDIVHVTTAAAAVARMENGDFDLVLLDLGLPDSQGFDTVVKFRTLFPGLPMVIVSGTDDEKIGIQAVECGAQDYVAKGLVAGQLLIRAIRFAVARQNQITSFKTEAHTDGLTGLSNRRAFDSEMAKCLSERVRNEPPLSLILMDIDHFKQINDTHGHRCGDFVLCELGNILLRSLRDTDFLARFGGEEFAVVLPGTPLDRAIPVGNRLVSAIAETVFQFEDHSIHVTASIGITSATRGDVPARLLQRADAALYAAKDAGRNCGYVHDGRACRAIG